jgi:hypothetical protein
MQFVVKIGDELCINLEGVGGPMLQTFWKQSRLIKPALLVAALAALMAPGAFAAVQTTTVRVLVKDATTGQPVYQARLTLTFRNHGGLLHRSKIISYTAKTDKDGKGQFPVVPLGTVTLMVTAPDHRTFGKEFEITKQNQLIEVELQKPHPVL